LQHLYTIGAYGFDAESFFDALEKEKIDLFLDIRRRRGVRGREYAFANATRLQEELGKRGIAYRHLIELAPDSATRALQDRADKESGVARRKRSKLGETFVEDFTRRVLEPFDFEALAGELREFNRPVLFCVEGAPEACHRSLVAARLAKAADVSVTHLVP
jgi:uncharacterized protein (DUF488 family)